MAAMDAFLAQDVLPPILMFSLRNPPKALKNPNSPCNVLTLCKDMNKSKFVLETGVRGGGKPGFQDTSKVSMTLQMTAKDFAGQLRAQSWTA